MMEITLQLSDGRKMTFSEQELTAIVQEYFERKEFEVKQNPTGFAQVPTEGKWFKVDPLTIDKNLFEETRGDFKQEATRQLILAAFKEMKRNPKYARPFKTTMPEKTTWDDRTVEELKKLAEALGDHVANWVEQAFEWAQRIANGESWEEICNKSDTANWYRLIVWKYRSAKLVGGSRNNLDSSAASDVSLNNCAHYMNHTVPLVVSYDV